MNERVDASAGNSSYVSDPSWRLWTDEVILALLPLRGVVEFTSNNQEEAALGPRYRVLPASLLIKDPNASAIVSSSFPSESAVDASSAGTSSCVSRTKSGANNGCAV
jgi:hypothetical protein